MTAARSRQSARSSGQCRKLIAALLILMVFLGSAAFSEDTAAVSASFTTQPYADYPSLFYVEADQAAGCTFIGTQLPTEQCAFTHIYESQNLYSLIQSDILVIDLSDGPFPVLRTWIYFASDNPHNIQSVTFLFEDKKYTFTDIADSERNEITEKGSTERLLIQYGRDNSDFLSDILVGSLAYLLSEDENAAAPEMKMILHGDEDIEAVIPDAFWQDFALLVLPYTNNDYAWLSYIGLNDGTPCTIE